MSFAMNILHFFKTNWFVIALFALILTAFVKDRQKNTSGPIKLQNRTEQRKSNPEKFTDATGDDLTATNMGFGIGNGNNVGLPEIGDDVAMAFFRRFRKVAEGEAQKFGIPASVILACAYTNSFAGSRDLVKSAHNYFALSCSANWEGKSTSHNGKCFRSYETAWESYRDFSETVAKQDWYADAKKTGKTKPEVWVSLLTKSGVSEVDDFENHALNAIQRYNLFELDKK
jgi:flagellum-specific peptidoglycan hydrolase FlgJ